MAIQSFSAICNANTHTVILGTMPGAASLDAHQYYAHKRNALWPILIGYIQHQTVDYALHQQLEYKDKIALLQQAGFGLWDVLAQCERKGSLDSNIQSSGIVANDFGQLFHQCGKLTTVVFNGKTAQRLFAKHVKPSLEQDGFIVNDRHVVSPANAALPISLFTLPSTSPAMASMTLEQKSEAWQHVLTQTPHYPGMRPN